MLGKVMESHDYALIMDLSLNVHSSMEIMAPDLKLLLSAF